MGAKTKFKSTDTILFSEAEADFIHKVIGGLDYDNYELSLDILNRIITNQINNITIAEADKLPVLESLQVKIYDWRATREVQRMLSDPSYGSGAISFPVKNLTKALSLKATRSTKSQCHALIVSKLKKGEMTRRELAEATGLRLHSVCGRVNELMSSGEVEVVGTKWDSDTERNVELLGVL